MHQWWFRDGYQRGPCVLGMDEPSSGTRYSSRRVFLGRRWRHENQDKDAWVYHGSNNKIERNLLVLVISEVKVGTLIRTGDGKWDETYIKQVITTDLTEDILKIQLSLSSLAAMSLYGPITGRTPWQLNQSTIFYGAATHLSSGLLELRKVTGRTSGWLYGVRKYLQKRKHSCGGWYCTHLERGVTFHEEVWT